MLPFSDNKVKAATVYEPGYVIAGKYELEGMLVGVVNTLAPPPRPSVAPGPISAPPEVALATPGSKWLIGGGITVVAFVLGWWAFGGQGAHSPPPAVSAPPVPPTPAEPAPPVTEADAPRSAKSGALPTKKPAAQGTSRKVSSPERSPAAAAPARPAPKSPGTSKPGSKPPGDLLSPYQ